ncbi:similar to 2210021J22Rik protein (predicted), isoform CRA_a [Rattus norvegicus]|uniref:Similar to 2210021J22Rik protein (Predicted), isoform CRA_a n=1 Tax=Rattus norvegicus TaxID=10116 RepID=A6HTF0_RAT|nr:similar to 2210021J22Rik protein (predicted), isoform CRA_a [Rattus norvegicus]EDM15572.1 similar to 2210021J22Rik protein (predicted), isoform CRA_a [Rattus norvegicus]|eukprot:NP_001124168.1 cysteine-rich DPF motif domain-containing protein 1 [Rattus norvegicus]
MPALCLNSSLQLCRAEAPRHPGCCPPGGELHHEGSLLLRQGQVSDPRFSVQCVQQAGVCGPGMQPVLLQEGLPPLCSEEYQCFPSGNPAGCGEEKGCQQEALQPSLTGRGTASCEALGWARPGFQLGAVYLVFSELCGVRAVSGTEELAKTEDRQQECSQLELQTWPLVEARSEGEGPPFDSW